MLNDFMVKILGLNWRTTFAGLFFATGNIIMDYANGVLTFKTFAVSFAFAVAGYIAKDAKVTGTELNPRAQVQGLPIPALSPTAKTEIAAIAEADPSLKFKSPKK